MEQDRTSTSTMEQWYYEGVLRELSSVRGYKNKKAVLDRINGIIGWDKYSFNEQAVKEVEL